MGYNCQWPALYCDPQIIGTLPRSSTVLLHLLPLATTAFRQATLSGAPGGRCKGDTSLHPRKAQETHFRIASWVQPYHPLSSRHLTPALNIPNRQPFAIPVPSTLLQPPSFLLSHGFGTLRTPEARWNNCPCFFFPPKFSFPFKSSYLRIKCLLFLERVKTLLMNQSACAPSSPRSPRYPGHLKENSSLIG